MTGKETIEKQVDRLKDEIKTLVKLLLDVCDPKGIYEEELMAACSASSSRLERLRSRVSNESSYNYSVILDNELSQCFAEFGQIIDMPALYVESQYRQFIQK